MPAWKVNFQLESIFLRIINREDKPTKVDPIQILVLNNFYLQKLMTIAFVSKNNKQGPTGTEKWCSRCSTAKMGITTQSCQYFWIIHKTSWFIKSNFWLRVSFQVKKWQKSIKLNFLMNIEVQYVRIQV